MHVPLEETSSPRAVVAAYRAAAKSAPCAVRGILFCNPHNPYGHIAPVGVIDAMLQYCEEADLHFVSDGIYALSTFGARRPRRKGVQQRFRVAIDAVRLCAFQGLA